jgi:5'-nucleotidase
MIRRAFLALALLTAAGCALPPPPPPLNPLRLVLVNDVYVLDTLSDGMGGLARVATVVKRVRSEGPTLFVLAGDVLSPSLLSKYYSGRQMVEGLNAAGLDYATFGNHEFELDRDTLVARISASSFKWLSANCTEASGAAFPGVISWDTVRMSGRLVGIFGLTLQERYRSYVRCSDPDSAAAVAIDSLSAMGAEFIVGLTHQSIGADRALLSRETRLDLILGGHEHNAIDETLNGRHILKADANSRTAQFVTAWGTDPTWQEGVALLRIDPRIMPEPTVLAVTRRWQDSLRARLGPEAVVATATAPIEARDAVSRREESAIGMLVTDAIREGTGADVAIINSGAIRLDDVIPAGTITNYTLESLFLFADETRVVAFTLTGARLREVLEHGVSATSVGTGAFLQVSGVAFTYDPTAQSGSRITGQLQRPDGTPISPAESLQVSFVAYPACEGGDGYQIPEAAAACQRASEGPRTADLLIQHLRGLSLVSPPAGGRIQRKQP